MGTDKNIKLHIVTDIKVANNTFISKYIIFDQSSGTATIMAGVGGSRADVLAKYMSLETTGALQVLYVWIDGSGQTLRCKTKTVYTEPTTPSDLPIWNFDGSSTNQAEGHNSDVYLHPIALFNDPFRGLPNKIVLCETYMYDHTPCATNLRKTCKEVMDNEIVKKAVPWFGIEQEYTLLDIDQQ